MGTKISHFIITSYDVGLFSDKSMLGRIGCSPEEWMEKRFPLFSGFTLPSLRNQTCRDFTWYVLLDQNTPAEYVRQLEDVAFDNMRLVKLTMSKLRYMRKEIEQANDIVITGRIDNDDAWHEDYVRVIQERHCKPTRLVQLPQCYWLDTATQRIYHWKWRWWYCLNRRMGNHPTMVEWRDRAKTVLVAPHTKIAGEVKWYQFKDDISGTYRLIVCHGGNLVMAVKDRIHRLVETNMDALKGFHVESGLEWMKRQGVGGGGKAPEE